VLETFSLRKPFENENDLEYCHETHIAVSESQMNTE